MLDANVFADRVAAPRATAEGERRSQSEVVQVAETAMAGRRVDNNAAGLHAFGKFIDLSTLGNGVEVDRRGVAVAAVGDEVFCFIESIVQILCLIHGKNRRKLFVCEFFGNIDRFDFADQNLGSFGNGDTGKSGNGDRLLTDDLGVERTVDENGLSDLFDFIRL